MKRSCVLVLATFLFVLTTAAFAVPPDPAPPVPPQMQGPWGGPARHRLAAFLNLTQEQRDKMKEIRSRFQADTHDLKYDIGLKRLEMRKVFTDPKTDDQTLLAKQKELGMLVQKLMERRGQMKIEWRHVLTPEQIQKLDRMPKGRGMRHHPGM
jgi:Spy/CpxP family protein refolding chaperone